MISSATEVDLPSILRLQRAAFREEAEYVGDPSIKPMTQTLEDLRTELSTSIILKYVRDGEIIGSVRGRSEGDICYISRLVVDPKAWSQGIGRELMRAMEDHFRGVDRYELFTRADHPRTRPFYQKLGYMPFRTERYSDTLTFVHLEKRRPNQGDL
jgi:ribosomal protein S18 acetylase RimI-like enzyme